METVFQYVLYGAQFLVAAILIVLVMSQSSRSEGLGAVGGASAPTSRGRGGMEEQLATYTKYTAFAFMVLSFLLYMFAMRFDWV
jgi:protein translocase SecG subunit